MMFQYLWHVHVCIVLKAKAMSDTLPEDIVASTAIDQLCTIEEQYLEATRRLEEVLEEATDADCDKVRQQYNNVQAQAMVLASQVSHALRIPTAVVAQQMEEEAQTQSTQTGTALRGGCAGNPMVHPKGRSRRGGP